MALRNNLQPAKPSGPEVRLLACGQCKTIEVLDDYQGPQELAAEYDVVLNIATEAHKDGVERREHAPAALMRIAKSDWDNPEVREQVKKQIIASFDPDAETGLGSHAYAIRDNFRADAMNCFREHRRNPECPDYRSSPKRLVPDTDSERKEAGMSRASEYDRNNPALTKYLCDYCPVHSMVMQKKRKDAGLYDK